MDIWDAISAAALRDVWYSRKDIPGEDPQYNLRRIFRWYSEKYSTALHLVIELPTSDIVQAYFEDLFEAMDMEDLELEVKKAGMSEAQLIAADMQADITAARDFVDMKESREHNAKLSSKRLEDIVSPMRTALEGIVKSVRREGKETELVPQKPVNKLPEGIKMQFVTEEELEAELNKENALNLFPRAKK